MDRQAVAAVATLDDDTRRALYAFVRESGEPVTREAAAAATGTSRKLAAFHLDKLVDAGLLESRIEAIGIRRVGRTPKVYEPSAQDVTVRVPQREPEILAAILIEAIRTERKSERAPAAATRVAREHGVAAGAAERERIRPGRVGVERALAITAALLAQHGFEPARDADGLRLRNCPFHPLTASDPELVCGLNHAFLDGVLEGLQAERALEAAPDPRPRSCCVQVRRR